MSVHTDQALKDIGQALTEINDTLKRLRQQLYDMNLQPTPRPWEPAHPQYPQSPYHPGWPNHPISPLTPTTPLIPRIWC